MKKTKGNQTFYEIVADHIDKDSAMTFSGAMEILEYSKPSKQNIAVVKFIIIDMKSRGIDIEHIKNACFGVTSGGKQK